VRVLLDEHLPVDLGRALQAHHVDTVVGRGWAGVKNGDLEFQQNISALPFGVPLIRADSNRMVHLVPLVPTILEALSAIMPGRVYRLGA
jgi:hypothetical protein